MEHGNRQTQKFQSTLSMRRATYSFNLPREQTIISIHALHEESDPATPAARVERHISIHALHEESDQARQAPAGRQKRISIHALHEESDTASTGVLL